MNAAIVPYIILSCRRYDELAGQNTDRTNEVSYHLSKHVIS